MELLEELFDKERKIEEAQKNENDKLRCAYHMVLKTPEGRQVLWDVMSMCHLYSLSMTGNSNTFFREGERNVGLRVLGRILEADPGAYPELMKENMEKPNE